MLGDVTLVDTGKKGGRALEARRERAVSGHFRISFRSTSPLSWNVESDSGHTYHVTVPGFPSREGTQCSCPDFLTRGLGTCKHVEAMLAFAALNPPPSLAPPESPHPSWVELERAHGEAMEQALHEGASREELVRAMRKVGRALTEPSGS